MQKLILSAVAAWHGFNGLFMLMMPARWYETVPGVTHTGPFNGHFIADIAIAFLACAAGLALAVRHRGPIAAALLTAPAIFLGGHAVLHAVEFFHGHSGFGEIARDTLIIIIPGLTPAAFVWHNLQMKQLGEAT